MPRYVNDTDDGHRSTRDRIYGDATSGRDGRRGLAAVLFAVSLFLLVSAVSVRQATAAGPARDILEVGIALTTEIDQIISEDRDVLRQAVESDGATTFTIPDYPLDVVLTRDEIVKSTDAELRRMVLERSSGLVYANGLDAFDRTGSQSFGRFSSQGLLELAVGQVSVTTHERASLFSAVLLLVVAGGTCFVLLAGEGWGRLRSLGFAIVGGAVPGLILAGIAWLVVGRAGGDDLFVLELRGIVRTLIEVPLRNYLVVAALGAVLAALGIAGGAAEARLGAGSETGDGFS